MTIEKITTALTPMGYNAKINEIIDKIGDSSSSSGGMGMPIGTEIALYCDTTYVPEGCVPCDGSEYSKSQFQDLWNNYLTSNLLNTCSYEEYEADLGAYGQCGKFAVNTALETFRVPYKKNGAVTQQALTTEELGKAYNEGLPNITATLGGIFGSAGALAKTSTRSNGSGDYDTQNADFNASRCSDVYGKTDDNSLNKVQVNAIALRFFVVIANGQLNQSMMDWSQWASNLTAKAEKTDVDGQWVTKITQILSTAGTLSQVRCDLSDYLPNDNYDYMVKFKLSGYDNDSTYGYYIDTDKWVTSLNAITTDDGVSSPCFQIYGGTYARQTNTIIDLPVGSQRYVQVSGMGGDNVYLSVLGYRRLGRNV